jgi:Type II secretion system (T2SS), protein M subtype b
MDPRHRRWLPVLGAILILGLAIRFWPEGSSTPAVVAPTADTIALAERRLEKLRETAATVPAREKILKDAAADLALREKGMLIADTAPQAQAQLIQMIRDLGRAETPIVEIRNTEGFGIRPFGDAYGEATVSVQLECRIDQLVNMLAGLAARKELVSTSDLRVNATNAKEKTIMVHLTVAGVVPRKLVPERLLQQEKHT